MGAKYTGLKYFGKRSLYNIRALMELLQELKEASNTELTKLRWTSGPNNMLFLTGNDTDKTKVVLIAIPATLHTTEVGTPIPEQLEAIIANVKNLLYSIAKEAAEAVTDPDDIYPV
jgi:predicted NAD/FAD-dependent oxidoreductase